MTKVIYSLYIDIPEKELDIFDKNILKSEEVPTNINTKKQFKDNYFIGGTYIYSEIERMLYRYNY